MLRQLFEDHRGGGNGVGAAEERQSGLFGRRHQSPRRCHIAVDRAVGALFKRRRSYRIGVGELMGVGCKVVSGIDGPFVRLGDKRVLACEFRIEIALGVIFRPLEEIEAYRRGEKTGTDWYDAVMRPLAPQTQHTLSARGGNEKMKYYLSAGYLYQESFLRSESLDYDRFNLRSNVTANLTDRLTVDFNMSGIMDQKDQPYTNADWIIRAMQRAPATQPIYANNNPEYLMYGWIEGDNPVAMMDADQVGHKTYNNKWFQSSVQATYDLPWIEGLQLKGMFSYDYQIADNHIYKKVYNEYEYDEASDTYIARTLQSPGTNQREHYTRQSWLYQVSLNYAHTFADKHNVSGLLLLEGQRRDGDNFYAVREMSLDSEWLFAGNATNQVGLMDIGEANLYQKANMGLIGRFSYDYQSKYLAEFSFRYDGSSMFASGAQWGFFPSASVGWRISKEAFWKESALSFIDNAKFRLSYGKLGDDGASSYQFATGYIYPASGASADRPGGYVFNGSYVNAVANKVINGVADKSREKENGDNNLHF